MLTIKHIEEGRERLFTANSIERTSEGFKFGTDEVITTGVIYVMNEYGKTVGNYDFSQKQNGAER